MMKKIGSLFVLLLFVVSMVPLAFAEADSASLSNTAADVDDPAAAVTNTDSPTTTASAQMAKKDRYRTMHHTGASAVAVGGIAKARNAEAVHERLATKNVRGSEYAKKVLAERKEKLGEYEERVRLAKENLVSVKSDVDAYKQMKIKCEEADWATEECEHFKLKLKARAKELKKDYTVSYAEQHKETIGRLISDVAKYKGEASEEAVLALAANAEEIAAVEAEVSTAAEGEVSEKADELKRKILKSRLLVRYHHLGLTIDRYYGVYDKISAVADRLEEKKASLEEKGIEISADFDEKLEKINGILVDSMETNLEPAKTEFEKIKSVAPELEAEYAEQIKELYRSAKEHLSAAKDQYKDAKHLIHEAVKILKDSIRASDVVPDTGSTDTPSTEATE